MRTLPKRRAGFLVALVMFGGACSNPGSGGGGAADITVFGDAGAADASVAADSGNPDAAASDAGARSDAAMGAQDAAVATPDAAVVTSDAAVATPDAAVVTPDASVEVPDAAVVTPDAAVVTPDASQGTPDAAVTVPDAGAPDAAPINPCGNGTMDALEVCDDGNRVAETTCAYGQQTCVACNANCTAVLNLVGHYCGDGTRDVANETCDDGNTTTETACPYGMATCTLCDQDCAATLSLAGAVCGDGTKDDGEEACDDGNNTSEGECDYGLQSCVLCAGNCQAELMLTGPYCGDGQRTAAEMCDDGNTSSETECPYGTASCTACDAACAASLALTGNTCGDGVPYTSEECDYQGYAGYSGYPNPACSNMCVSDSVLMLSYALGTPHYNTIGSGDGRYAAWHTRDTTLLNAGNTTSYDIYERDIKTGAVQVISKTPAGTGTANADCVNPDYSADGAVLAFHSAATNLDPDDTDASVDVYVYTRATGTLNAVTAAGTTGTTFADSPKLSANGRYVVFRTDAALLTGDGSTRHIVRYDLQTDTALVVSRASDGAFSNSSNNNPGVSDDGNIVVWESGASNLVQGDTNGTTDIFVRDISAGVTSRVSVSSASAQGNGASTAPVISANGRYVGFISAATNLAGTDTNAKTDVFGHDRTTGVTTRLTLTSQGVEPTTNNRLVVGGVSNGGAVVFSTDFSLVATDPDSVDIYAYDLSAGTLTMVSTNAAGAHVVGFHENPKITADGHWLYFQSNASGLAATGLGGSHAYRKRL